LQRRLEHDHGVVGVHQRRPGDPDTQTPFGRAAVDAVIRVGRVVDEGAPLLQPGVDRIPRYVDESGCPAIRWNRLTGQALHLVRKKCVAERTILPVHQQYMFCVDYCASAEKGLNASRMRLDIDHICTQWFIWGRKPSRWIIAEWTVSGDQTHTPSTTLKTRTSFCRS
jgi:hypothetical protein